MIEPRWISKKSCHTLILFIGRTIKPMSRHGHPRFLDKIDNRCVPFLCISNAGRQRNNQSFIRAKLHYGNMGNISRFRCNVAKFRFHPPFSFKEGWWLRIYIIYNRLEIYSVCYYLSIYASFARRNFDVIGDSKRVVIPRFCFGLGNWTISKNLSLCSMLLSLLGWIVFNGLEIYSWKDECR